MVIDWIVAGPCGPRLFLAVALLFSVFYGLNCWTINELDVTHHDRWRHGHPSWKFHQVWLNFLGSALGWWAFWCVLLDYRDRVAKQQQFTYVDFALVVVALLGMTGYLPHVSRFGSNIYPGKK